MALMTFFLLQEIKIPRFGRVRTISQSSPWNPARRQDIEPVGVVDNGWDEGTILELGKLVVLGGKLGDEDFSLTVLASNR